MKELALIARLQNLARATCSGLLLVAMLAAPLQAQRNSQETSVFIEQAPHRSVDATQVGAPVTAPPASKVYFPDAITPQSVAAARARAAEQQQVKGPASPGDQVTQLSDGDSARALAQLSPAERQVVLEAVEGTDICERADNIPAIRDLCAGRIETRSADFAQTNTGGSAEDNLLGGRFDSARLATLEAAINRLAQSSGRAEDFSDQAIASVALGQQATLSDAQATAAEHDPASDLSPETQGVINAIVQQLGGGG